MHIQSAVTARRFQLHRARDVTGVSGTGVVADGVQFPDGTVALRWRGTYASTVVWDSVAAAEHVHGHGGATRVVWIDPQDAAVAETGQDGRPVYRAA